MKAIDVSITVPLKLVDSNGNEYDYNVYHDGMELNWDKMSEIYEDEKTRVHFIVFNQNKIIITEMLKKMVSLGILDFGYSLMLKSFYISLWYYPGNVEEFKEQLEKAVNK